MEQLKKIKFAVVGCGSIGTRHLAVLNAEPNAELVALCDIDEKKRKELARIYGVSGFKNYAEMLSKTDADVINICTPHTFHAPMAVEAAHTKKHILVEKPMSLSSTDAEAMIQAAKSNNVLLMVVKQNRYNKPVELVNQAIRAGKLGKIFMVKCDVLWNRGEDYYKNSTWRGRKATEGGTLYTQVSHFIDLLIWWCGDLIKANSHVATQNHDIETEDSGSAVLKFSSGALGSLTWTTCVPNKNYEGSITLIGERGTVKIGGPYLNKIEFWDVKDYPLPEGTLFEDKPNVYAKYQGTSSNHDKVIADVVKVLNGKPNIVVYGEEGAKTSAAIELIYKSAFV
ncbi:MAG TPA: Gfo/Idh/MocA family oxidoreductase [Candidatus Paceibacterota bacterium]